MLYNRTEITKFNWVNFTNLNVYLRGLSKGNIKKVERLQIDGLKKGG